MRCRGVAAAVGRGVRVSQSTHSFRVTVARTNRRGIAHADLAAAGDVCHVPPGSRSRRAVRAAARDTGGDRAVRHGHAPWARVLGGDAWAYAGLLLADDGGGCAVPAARRSEQAAGAAAAPGIGQAW